MTNKKQILTTVLSVLVSVFLVASVAYAITTVSGTTITLENSATIANSTAGQIEVAGLSSPAAGANGLYVVNTLATAANLTGEIIGGRFAANSNANDTNASGSVKGVMSQARACVPDGTPGTVFELAAFYGSADAKDSTGVSYLRGMEVSLDGLAGSAATLAQGVLISNNSSGVQTTSYALDINSGTAVAHKAFTADIRLQNGETIDNATNGIVTVGGNVLINGAETDDTSGYEQFFKVTGALTGVGSGSGSKTWVMNVDATRAAGADITVGDSNDMGLKVAMTNKATGNTAGYYMRGLDVAVSNRDGGSITSLYGGHISATQKGSSAVSTDLWGLSVKVEANSPNTAATNVIGVNVEYDMVAPTGAPTISAGVRVNQNSDYYSAYPLAGFMVDNGATNRPWQYGLYIDNTTIGTADIRLSSGALIFTGAQTTRAAVLAEVGAANDATGSIYLSTAGKLYVQVADTGALTDWQKVTTTVAD